MQRVQGRNISRSAVELEGEFLKHWKNNQGVTAVRCSSSDLSKLESESFVLKVAAQEGRGGDGSVAMETTLPPVGRADVTHGMSLEMSQQMDPEGESNPAFPRKSLEPCKVAFSPLNSLEFRYGNLQGAPHVPSPWSGRQGHLSTSPKPVGGKKLQILEGLLLLYSPN